MPKRILSTESWGKESGWSIICCRTKPCKHILSHSMLNWSLDNRTMEALPARLEAMSWRWNSRSKKSSCFTAVTCKTWYQTPLDNFGNPPKSQRASRMLSRLKAGRVRVSSPPNWSPHNMIIIESKFQCQCIIWFKTIVAWLKAGFKSGHWKWSVCACVFFPFLLAWLRKWIFVQVPLQKWPSSIANPNLARKCNRNFRIIMGGGDGTRDPSWALPRSRISYYGNIKNLFVAGKSKILSSK